MAESREVIEPPKPWEILGAFFGYFAVAKDAPSTLRTLGLTKLILYRLKDGLLSWNMGQEVLRSVDLLPLASLSINKA